MVRTVAIWIGIWMAAGSMMSVGTIAYADTAYDQFRFPEIAKDAKEPVVLGPAGETIEFIKTGATTCGRYLFAKVIVPPTVGPPPHVHHWTDEWFYAPNGGFVIFMGTNEYPDLEKPPGDGAPKDTLQIMKMRPKELFYGERYIVHGFENPTEEPQELYIVWTPDTPDVSILPYFLNAGVARNPDIPDQKPDFMSRIRLVSMAPEYGINQSSSFWQYVDKVVEVEHDHAMPDNRQRLLDLLSSRNACDIPGREH
ncbi:TPA: cupin domain-containing protein [Pseudomonas aeruginosa]|nr:cupin domain-containing protein [Pseudomonas aeruginosa]